MEPIHLRIAGLEIIADVTQVALGPIDDIPEQIALWKAHAAIARQEAARVDAEYREWRARETTAALSLDGKIAEWKLRAKIEQSPQFLLWKQGAATAALNVEICEAMAAGYAATARILDGAPEG